MNSVTGKQTAGETSSSGAIVDAVLGSLHAACDPIINEDGITVPASYDHSLPYLFGNKDDYLNFVVPLFEASVTGDWETAKSIFDERPDLVRIGLSKNLGMALHVAVTAKETKQTLHFVKNLVFMMSREDLEIKNRHGNTAFMIACATGKLKMATMMMEKNGNLVYIRGNIITLPLSFAAMNGTLEMVKWLYDHSQKMTGHIWTGSDRIFVLCHCVDRGFFDIALQILEDHQELPLNNVSILLAVLAPKPYTTDHRVENKLILRITESTCRFFGMKKEEDSKAALKFLKIIWKHATRTMSVEEIQDMLQGPSNFLLRGIQGILGELYTLMAHNVEGFLSDGIPGYLRGFLKGPPSSGILFVAAEAGNTMFVAEVLRSYPDIMLDRNDDGLTVFHIAVMHRHRGIYNLLYEIGSSSYDVCVFKDKLGNNMLHLVGKTSKAMASKTPASSLPMQRELLWFLEVEKMMPPFLREEKNKAGETAYELFYKENKDLAANRLKWMKDCMVVATLIVTVAFAAAFTVPGDYNEKNGLPNFIKKRVFFVFVIADAISLFSSSTSLLVFLSILTSRQEQHDFYVSLPSKLMTGLLSLLISVGAMMVTFSASFFVLYHKKLKWVPILIATFAAIPVIVFAVLQSSLLLDMFRSMYDSHYLFNPKKRVLYTAKPTTSRSNNSSCWWFSYKSIIRRIFKKRPRYVDVPLD